MRTIFSLLFGMAFVVITGWYVVYKSNPNRICEMHPDPEKQAEYLYCLPGFDMRKDTFIDGHSPIEKKSMIEQKRNHILKKSKKVVKEKVEFEDSLDDE